MFTPEVVTIQENDRPLTYKEILPFLVTEFKNRASDNPPHNNLNLEGSSEAMKTLLEYPEGKRLSSQDPHQLATLAIAAELLRQQLRVEYISDLLTIIRTRLSSDSSVPEILAFASFV